MQDSVLSIIEKYKFHPSIKLMKSKNKVFFRVPTKDDEYSINWRNNIVALITRDTVMKAI